MNDETVVPLRPGFDNEFRGFNRSQVLEHIEQLEDQVRILITDRDEAIRLNEDQRRITDETRRQMEDTAAELKRLESSETGLPHATRRMQNMLTMADQEASSIREHARRDAETIRGTASTDAEQIRGEAETAAKALREECAELVQDLEQRRNQLEQEHTTRTADLESRRQELHQSAKAAYEEAVATGHQEATELLRKTTQRCEEMEAASRHYHSEIMNDIDTRAGKLEHVRQLLVDTLETVSGFADARRTELTQQLASIRSVADLEHPNRGQLEDGQSAEQPSPAEHQPATNGAAAAQARIPVQTDQDLTQRNDNGQQPVNTTADGDTAHDDVPLIHQSPTRTFGVGASAHPVEHRN